MVPAYAYHSEDGSMTADEKLASISRECEFFATGDSVRHFALLEEEAVLWNRINERRSERLARELECC